MKDFYPFPSSGANSFRDFYYRFPNSGIAYQLAYAAGFLSSGVSGYSLVKFTPNYAIDLIGEVITGYLTGISGQLIPLADSSYHLNLRVLSDSFNRPSGAENYLIPTPKNPVRRFL